MQNTLNEKFINDNKEYNIDKINKINFPRILPFNYDEINDTSKVVCECVNDYGSIFGHLYINHAFLLFVSASFGVIFRIDKDEINVTKIIKI